MNNLKMNLKGKKPHYRCSVTKCGNTSTNSNRDFYIFPTDSVYFAHRLVRRQQWINAVRKQEPEGSLWVPNKYSRICSEHFVGGRKSEHPHSPSYNPTIFPGINTTSHGNSQAALERFKRRMKRTQSSTSYGKLKLPKSDDVELPSNTTTQCDVGIQVDFLDQDDADKSCLVFICNRYTTSTSSDAETQCFSPSIDYTKPNNRNDTLVREIGASTTVRSGEMSAAVHENIIPNTVMRGVEARATDEDISTKKSTTATSHKSRCSLRSTKVGKKVDSRINSNAEMTCELGFHGYSDLADNDQLIDVAGVNQVTFDLLLKILKKDVTNVCDGRRKINHENQLLIFLMKIKLGLTFSSMGALFGRSRITISRIFHRTLRYLSAACKNFVFWPTKEAVQETMPEDFTALYSNCRVIIDCTEFLVERPSSVEMRVRFFSHYKHGFRLKVLVGCTPSGMISFVSRVYGGRATDSQITTDCGFLDLLEPGDLVLADKGFPQIKTKLADSGRNVLMIMPPFLCDGTFTEDEVNETYNVAKVRIHIERIMQRIRIYRIVDKFTTEMLPFSDDIIFVCCVLVNLQPPIIKG